MLEHFISRRRQDILAELGRRIAEEQPEKRTDELLINLPQFVDGVIVALRANSSEQAARPSHEYVSESAARAGEERYRIGVPLAMVATSFGKVCEVVSALAAGERLDLPAREVSIMNECIDAGIASALNEYWKHKSVELEHTYSQRLGFLAHELRNALGTATLAFDAFRSGRVGSTGATAAILLRSFDRMESLVSHALAEAQLKTDPTELMRVPLHELVEELDILPDPQRSVRLVIDVPRGVDVTVDARLFGSALGNLVQNALKFTHPGGQVSVRGRVEGNEVVIDVEDQCGGLKDNPEELFEPFAQRHEDRSGVGLGLSIARDSVERLGGTLHARNLPASGCVFSIRLPCSHTPRR